MPRKIFVGPMQAARTVGPRNVAVGLGAVPHDHCGRDQHAYGAIVPERVPGHPQRGTARRSDPLLRPGRPRRHRPPDVDLGGLFCGPRRSPTAEDRCPASPMPQASASRSAKADGPLDEDGRPVDENPSVAAVPWPSREALDLRLLTTCLIGPSFSWTVCRSIGPYHGPFWHPDSRRPPHPRARQGAGRSALPRCHPREARGPIAAPDRALARLVEVPRMFRAYRPGRHHSRHGLL